MFVTIASPRLAERVEASVAVQRWWKSVLAKYLRQQEKTHWEIQDLHLRIRDAKAEILDLKDDLADVYKDRKRLRRARRRLEKARKNLKEEGVSMEWRLPEVERELELLEDAEEDPHTLGWAEAYETDWDILTNTIEMIREDRSSSKVKMEELDTELVDLQIEAEGLEMEIDTYTEKAFTLEQELHCAEMRFAVHAFNSCRSRAIARQRQKWRVKSTRTRVLERQKSTGEELQVLIETEQERLLRAQSVAGKSSFFSISLYPYVLFSSTLLDAYQLH